MEVSSIVAFCALSLFIAVAVKGAVGLGLPLVPLPLLTMVLGLKTSVGILIVPIFTSNLVQSFQGGRFMPTLKRFWPVFVPLIVLSMLATQAPVVLPERYLAAFIGIAVICFPPLAHFQPKVRFSPAQERWLGPVMGAVAGLLGGATTFYGPPLMLYLAGLKLPKDSFVAAVSLLFFMGSSRLRRRALATRWTGDDARYAVRKGEVAIPTSDPGLRHGDAMDCALFPRLWPRPEEGDAR